MGLSQELSVAAPLSLAPPLGSALPICTQSASKCYARRRRERGRGAASESASLAPSFLLCCFTSGSILGLAHVLHGKVGHGGSGQAEFPEVKQSVHPAVLIIPDSNIWEAVCVLTLNCTSASISSNIKVRCP